MLIKWKFIPFHIFQQITAQMFRIDLFSSHLTIWNCYETDRKIWWEYRYWLLVIFWVLLVYEIGPFMSNSSTLFFWCRAPSIDQICTRRTQNISKKQNLYPYQSRITFSSLLWDTLYLVKLDLVLINLYHIIKKKKCLRSKFL